MEVKKQLNVRLPNSTFNDIDRIRDFFKNEVGLNLSQSDVVNMAIVELLKRVG